LNATLEGYMYKPHVAQKRQNYMKRAKKISLDDNSKASSLRSTIFSCIIIHVVMLKVATQIINEQHLKGLIHYSNI